MSSFERIYQTDPSRESHIERERCCIEMSDQEYLERLMLSREMLDAGYVFNPPDESTMSPALKEKFELAKKLTKEILPRKKDEKNKNKVSKKTTKKVHSKSNSPTVESIQKKL